MKDYKLMLGDNIESLKKLPDNSIDSIVSDPPYGLSFMNKKWDYEVPSVEFWREVYRVLKPGGHILSFGGTRTYHRMVVNIEDAGFEIRDQIMWIYGSGFPKSHNISKAIDATIKTGKSNPKAINQSEMTKTDGKVVEVLQPNNGILGDKKLVTKTIGASLETSEAQQYEGWGTALKPANEPICLARKPLSEKSVAQNVLKWRTGGINVDGTRIGTDDVLIRDNKNSPFNVNSGWNSNNCVGMKTGSQEGRFPANLIFECCCDVLEKGDLIKGNENYKWNNTDCNDANTFKSRGKYTPRTEQPDVHTNPHCPCYQLDQQSGGASRFFYVAKVSKKERNLGVDSVEIAKNVIPQGEAFGNGSAITDVVKGKGNNHPTVKPINLLTYLCRLITPPNGIVLDPFMGSGSTGISAQLEGFGFIGMEMDADYFKIAEARIDNWEQYKTIKK